jgi:hypothetical protein
VLDGKEEGKLAESIDTCTEVVKCLVQSVMENCVDLREGVYGREVGNELWLSGFVVSQILVLVKKCLSSEKRNDVVNQLRGEVRKYPHCERGCRS